MSPRRMLGDWLADGSSHAQSHATTPPLHSISSSCCYYCCVHYSTLQHTLLKGLSASSFPGLLRHLRRPPSSVTSSFTFGFEVRVSAHAPACLFLASCDRPIGDALQAVTLVVGGILANPIYASCPCLPRDAPAPLSHLHPHLGNPHSARASDSVAPDRLSNP
ncbi:hypothetical protein K431DRAFT_9056 [Polychaeton citri CBS 116435]|uniref:Uncharacterized protein n=1 Tax=Polychaeton citri CBS 116435 TaxID=1314669 RepID=A0A9P4UPW9_9PEZI|nr:hypothetical protein K431DRAFT_9056 [Polychaeton citri CBS 116435]